MKQLSLLIIVSLFLPVVVLASFNEVSLTTGTTLRLTVGGTTLDLTVTNGTVERVDVYTGSLDITLAGGSSIDLVSANRFTFSYTKSNAIVSETCGSSSSSLGIALASGQTTEIVSVSPSTTICQAATSGSGGSTTTTTTTTTATTPAPTTTSSAAPSTTTTTPAPATPTKTTTTTTAKPAAPAITTPVVTMPVVQPTRVVVSPLTSEINPGARNDEVMKLQELLAQDPTIYPEGTVSGFYGPKTTAAVKKFQAKYGLPTVGRVGPATLAKLNEIFGETTTIAQPTTPSVQSQTANQIQSQIQAIQQQIGALTSGSAATVSSAIGVSIDSELNPGARSDEVMDLQKLLAQDPTIYPEGTISGFYGPKTTAAVKKFQAKYGLPMVGRVGPATMQKINEVLGGSAMESAPMVPQTSYTPVTPTPVSSSDTAKQIADQIKAIQAQIDALLKK